MNLSKNLQVQIPQLMDQFCNTTSGFYNIYERLIHKC